MVTTDKAALLMSFLSGLPEPLALRLAKAVELDRLSEGNLPHDLILDGLRPLLRRALRVDRTPTPKRLFCRPFEDILTSSPRREKQKGRIARSSVEPVWTWLSQMLLPEETCAYQAAVRAAVLAYRMPEALATATCFWKLAGQAMHSALSDESSRKSARLALGGDTALADAEEMAILVSAAPFICELQDAMPRPQHTLSESMLDTSRSICGRLAISCPNAAPYAAAIAMNRLEKPWEALRLHVPDASQTPDTQTGGEDIGLAGELLLSDLDAHVIVIRSIRQPQFDAGELIENLAGFATLSIGIANECEMRRDNGWNQRLMKDRAAVAEIMDDMMKKAPREILSAIPTLKTGSYAGGPRVPDLSRPPGLERTRRAVEYARLLAGCRPLCDQLAFSASLAQADNEACIALKRYCEDIVRELRAAEEGSRERAEQYFALTVSLAGVLFSPVEGEFLRRRGRAAVSAQAAA